VQAGLIHLPVHVARRFGGDHPLIHTCTRGELVSVRFPTGPLRRSCSDF